jgi:hypothetical protein
VHDDRANAHFAAGALDAKRDLAAIRDQDFLELAFGALFDNVRSAGARAAASASLDTAIRR